MAKVRFGRRKGQTVGPLICRGGRFLELHGKGIHAAAGGIAAAAATLALRQGTCAKVGFGAGKRDLVGPHGGGGFRAAAAAAGSWSSSWNMTVVVVVVMRRRRGAKVGLWRCVGKLARPRGGKGMVQCGSRCRNRRLGAAGTCSAADDGSRNHDDGRGSDEHCLVLSLLLCAFVSVSEEMCASLWDLLA